MDRVPSYHYPRLLLIGLCFCALLVGLASWSPHPYWPDAQGYAESVKAGRWVAHPPGYLFFVTAGMLVHQVVADPYRCVQIVSFTAWMISIPVLYAGLRRSAGEWAALGLTAVFAFSWIPLVICQAGTSHAVDLLLINLLLGVGVVGQLRQAGRVVWFWGLLAVIAGFRLTTLIMLAPLAVLVLWHGRRDRLPWVCAGALGLWVVGLCLLTIRLSGGWAAYSDYARSMAGANGPSSVILHGLTGQTSVNVFRSLFWFLTSAGLVLLSSLPKLRWKEAETQILFAAVAGPLAVTTLYLATHPGYVAPALPGVFFLAARTWESSKSQRLGLLAALLLSLGWFFGCRVIRQPNGKLAATANALVLQYSRDGVKNCTFRPLSSWLVEAGAGESAPRTRLEDLQREKGRAESTSRPASP